MNSEKLIVNSETVWTGPVSAQNKNTYDTNVVGRAISRPQEEKNNANTVGAESISAQIKSSRAITLIALIITIIIMLILAGVVLNLTLGEHGIFKTATQAGEEYKKAEIKEEIELAIIDIQKEEIIKGNEVTLETLSNGQLKDKLNGITTILNTNEITGEYKNYDYIIEENLNVIIGKKEIGGVRPIFNVKITKEDGEPLEGGETKKVITINIENIEEFGDNYEIEVRDEHGNVIEKQENVVGSLIGQASFIIGEKGNYTITVKGTKEGKTKTSSKVEKVVKTAKQFTKENGVIDIVWLNENNTVRSTPLSPATHLGGLQPITWNESEWVTTDTNNTDNKWYNYEEQTGTIDGKTSNWANARSIDENAYFVWIPRYAYKITYFDTKTNADAYRANRNSTQGIVGYSTINGMISEESDNSMLVEGTVPTNVTGKVQDERYSDYIPHPAFEFGGPKAGIWVGKFESSGQKDNITIIPNVLSLNVNNLSEAFISSRGLKETYGLAGDTHMMKNTEWGVVAYLAESKYGRNATEVGINSLNYNAGGGNYVSYANQSTTGNVYGIYDMNGTSWEYMAAYVENDEVSSNKCNDELLKAVKENSKYADIYRVTVDTAESNYNNNKGMRGDAVYETSTAYENTTSWNGDYSYFPNKATPVFMRSRAIFES